MWRRALPLLEKTEDRGLAWALWGEGTGKHPRGLQAEKSWKKNNRSGSVLGLAWSMEQVPPTVSTPAEARAPCSVLHRPSRLRPQLQAPCSNLLGPRPEERKWWEKERAAKHQEMHETCLTSREYRDLVVPGFPPFFFLGRATESWVDVFSHNFGQSTFLSLGSMNFEHHPSLLVFFLWSSLIIFDFFYFLFF